MTGSFKGTDAFSGAEGGSGFESMNFAAPRRRDLSCSSRGLRVIAGSCVAMVRFRCLWGDDVGDEGDELPLYFRFMK